MGIETHLTNRSLRAQAIFTADETGRLTLPRRSTRTLLTASMPGRILAQSLEVGAEQHEARLVLVVPVGLEGRLEPAASGHLMLVDPELGETIRRTPIGRDGRFRLDGIQVQLLRL